MKDRPGREGASALASASASAGVALGLGLTLEKPPDVDFQLVLVRHWGLLWNCCAETPGPSPLLHPPSPLSSSEQGMLFGPQVPCCRLGSEGGACRVVTSHCGGCQPPRRQLEPAQWSTGRPPAFLRAPCHPGPGLGSMDGSSPPSTPCRASTVQMLGGWL